MPQLVSPISKNTTPLRAFEEMISTCVRRRCKVANRSFGPFSGATLLHSDKISHVPLALISTAPAVAAAPQSIPNVKQSEHSLFMRFPRFLK